VHQLWAKIVAFMEAASKQRHMVALRDGMIGAVPIILVGSMFLLVGAQGEVLAMIPGVAGSSFLKWYSSVTPLLLVPFRFTMGLLSLYVTFTIAAALAREYGLPPTPNGLTAMACFLLTNNLVRVKLSDAAAAKAEWVLAVTPLGADGLFLAIIMGLLTVEVSRKLTYLPKEGAEGMTKGVPPAVVQAFASFLPMLSCVFLVWLIRHGLGIDVQDLIIRATSWVKDLGDTFIAMLVINLLLHLFGVAGVHGISVINAAMLPVWIIFLTANSEAHTAGHALPYVTAFPFYQWFIWIGGSGATLAPTVRCLFSKNAHVKRIGKISIVPAIFNINEPLLFGLPIVANPVLALPFILAPMVCGTVAYFATSWGLVGRAFIEAPWVMPCFLGAYFSTSDVKAVLLLLVNFAISYAIWAPFVSAYEHRLESAETPTAEEAPLLSSPPAQEHQEDVGVIS
jgi:PTS system cellobiose-specific IIC component